MSASVVKTVKLPRPVAAALSRAARLRGCSESELIREGIEQVTRKNDGYDMQALIGSDLGVGRGPRDLARNKARRAGYGRSRHR
jgi:hypothetical protein